MAVGRLAVHGAAGRHRPWLAAQLLSHYVAHGKRVEAAVKDVARCDNKLAMFSHVVIVYSIHDPWCF